MALLRHVSRGRFVRSRRALCFRIVQKVHRAGAGGLWRGAHYVRVHSESEFDETFAGWIRETYQVGLQKHLGKA
ncbi:MAG: DUF5655 domain-containing protein [bacterium]